MRMRALLLTLAMVTAVVASPTGADADAGTGTVEGRVTEWGTGLPIEGVVVSSYHSPVAQTITDVNGDYSLTGIAPDSELIHFDHPDAGYVDNYYGGGTTWDEATEIVVAADTVVTGIDGGLQPYRTLIGRVRDDQTGDPVAGICGEAYNNATTTGKQGVSDADGWLHINYGGSEYETTRVHLFDCNDLGYADEWYQDIPSLGSVTGDAVYDGLPPSQGRFDALVGLDGAIAGTVVDPEGMPVAGVCVAFSANLDIYRGPTAVTGSDGTYFLGGLAAYDDYVLYSTDCEGPIGYASGVKAGISVSSGSTTSVPIVMAPTASISGTVVQTGSGQPVEGMCVEATDDPVYQNPVGSDVTDAAGGYSIQVDGDETYWVEVKPCGDTRDRYVGVWFDDAPDFSSATGLAVGVDETVTSVDFVLDAMARVSGTLTRSDGGPAAGACVRVVQAEGDGPSYPATADGNGEYLIDTIPPGSYNIYFGCGYMTEYYDDQSDQDAALDFTVDYNDELMFDAELEPVGSIQGQVLPNAGGTLGTACVYATDPEGAIVASAMTEDRDPVYYFEGLPLGEYLLFAEDCDTGAPTFAPTWRRDAATRSGADPFVVEQRQYGDVDIWVDPYPTTMTSVAGATTKDGGPWDACVTAFDEQRNVVGETVASGGVYEIGDIELFGPAAALYVEATDCGGTVSGWYGGAAQADATAIPYGAGIAFDNIDIAVDTQPIPEPMQLDVDVTSLTGRALSGICVAVAGQGVSTAEVSDALGTASFDLYEPGVYDIEVGTSGAGCADGYETEARQLTVTADSALLVALGLEIDSFADVSSSVFAADVDWLAAAGVTRGCNPPVNDMFCPGAPVTRGQMAAFLSRALGLTERLDDPFGDDDGTTFEADIERLAAAGITKGCNPPVNDLFCPSEPVSRGQMAAFLVRALGYTDSGDGDLFIDDDGSVFEDAIDKLATSGVTKGCNPPVNDMFCPDAAVTRGQMAAFLHRALG